MRLLVNKNAYLFKQLPSKNFLANVYNNRETTNECATHVDHQKRQ